MAAQKLYLTHEQAERQKTRSQEFERGYQRGWYHQPDPDECDSEDFKQGYVKGWNDRVMDGN